jgi:hypothetical protein
VQAARCFAVIQIVGNGRKVTEVAKFHVLSLSENAITTSESYDFHDFKSRAIDKCEREFCPVSFEISHYRRWE